MSDIITFLHVNPTDIYLGLAAIVTSTLAGILGFGGGMTLIAIMPSFLPAAAIVPVHGVTQLFSNVSRALFSLKFIEWRLLTKFIWGSALGLALFTYVLHQLPSHFIPLAIGVYLLLNLWSKRFGALIEKYHSITLLGFFQTGLALLIGAPGPIAMPLLMSTLDCKDKVVATNALFMTISHLSKLCVLGVMGFQFIHYIPTLACMVCGAVIGSYIGTQLRSKIDQDKYITIVKVLLTALALRMIYQTIL